jgi:hypothetical protein
VFSAGLGVLLAVVATAAVLAQSPSPPSPLRTTSSPPSPLPTTSSSSPSPTTSSSPSTGTPGVGAVTLTPDHGPALSYVKVGVTGFGACLAGVHVTWDTSNLGDIRITGEGKSTGTFSVPSDAVAGPHDVTATCFRTRTTGRATFTVAPAVLRLDPQQGAAGSTATASGTGFACPPGDAVTLLWDGGSTLATQTPDPAGDFSTTITVPPDAAVNEHHVQAYCPSIPGIKAEVTFQIPAPGPTTPPPNGTLTASPGSTVPVSGSANACTGATGPGAVELSWDGRPMTSPVPLDGTGHFTADVAVPADATPGVHRVTVACADSHTVTQTIPVTIVAPRPPNYWGWVIGGMVAAAAVTGYALRRMRRLHRTRGRVAAEISGSGVVVWLTEPGAAGPSRTVRLEPYPDPGVQTIEEVDDDHRRDG